MERRNAGSGSVRARTAFGSLMSRLSAVALPGKSAKNSTICSSSKWTTILTGKPQISRRSSRRTSGTRPSNTPETLRGGRNRRELSRQGHRSAFSWKPVDGPWLPFSLSGLPPVSWFPATLFVLRANSFPYFRLPHRIRISRLRTWTSIRCRVPSLATVTSRFLLLFIMEDETPGPECFRAVNLTKRESVEPWVFGQQGELSDWLTGPYAGILSLLLCQQVEVRDSSSVPSWMDPTPRIVGSWAGDQVVLISDISDRALWMESYRYRSIARDLAVTWNAMVSPDRQIQQSFQ